MVKKTVLLALAATLVTAASAHADAIVYIKRGDVWIARPDGSRPVALTRDGTPRLTYSSPSISDDGTIVALRGSKLHSFRPSGRRIKRPLQWALSTQTLSTVPISVDLSPNGRVVATDLALYEAYVTPNNEPAATMIARYTEFSVFRRNRTIGQTDSYFEYGLPAWTGPRSVLATNIGIYGAQVIRAPLGKMTRGSELYTDPARDPLTQTNEYILSDAEMTRSGDRFAVMRRPLQGASSDDPGPNTIQVYATGAPPAGSTPLCTIGPGRGLDFAPDPSWSPDGSRLYWHEVGRGLYSSPVTSAPGCGLNPKLIARGAVQPDLSKARAPRRG